MFSREGFTVDVLARLARQTALNPWLALPFLVTTWGHPECLPPLGFACSMETVRPWLYALVLAGVSLSANDWLNKWSANNWTKTNPSDWNWGEEIVLITGGSGGIGASIAQQLLARNSSTKIIIVDYIPLTWSPRKRANVWYYKCDLSDSSSIRSLCSEIRTEVGAPTVLVNNAGLCRGFTVAEGSYHDVQLTIKTNLLAPFLLTKEFLPAMASQDHGHVINVSSVSSLVPPAKVGDYAATKAGITALHETLQLELRHLHEAPKVRLSLAVLSFIKTPLFKGETRQSGFLFPLLHVDSVGEAIVETLYSGYGRTIYMPGIMRYVAMIRAAPEWLMRIVREGTQSLAVDFQGRQKVNEKTGGLE